VWLTGITTSGKKTGMDIDACLAWLKAHKKDAPALHDLSERSGVSFHTLRKIASEETKDPGIKTMRKVLAVWPEFLCEQSEAA
jgi:hypothetical protein